MIYLIHLYTSILQNMSIDYVLLHTKVLQNFMALNSNELSAIPRDSVGRLGGSSGSAWAHTCGCIQLSDQLVTGLLSPLYGLSSSKKLDKLPRMMAPEFQEGEALQASAEPATALLRFLDVPLAKQVTKSRVDEAET